MFFLWLIFKCCGPMDFHFHSLAINWARSGCCPVDVDVNGVYAIKILASPSTRKVEVVEGVESTTTTARMALVGAIVIILIYVVCCRQCGCSCFSSIAHTPRCQPASFPKKEIPLPQSHLILNPHRFIANYPATRQWSIAAKFMDTNFGNKMPLGGRTFPFPFLSYLHSVPCRLPPALLRVHSNLVPHRFSISLLSPTGTTLDRF